jgi:nitroreductase
VESVAAQRGRPINDRGYTGASADVGFGAPSAGTDQDLDRIAVVPGASVYPFVWNVLLAARNEGYGGVLTTMAIAEEPRVKELLGVPDTYAIAAIVPLGKPVRQVTKLRRRPVPEFVTRERFDGTPFTG